MGLSTVTVGQLPYLVPKHFCHFTRKPHSHQLSRPSLGQGLFHAPVVAVLFYCVIEPFGVGNVKSILQWGNMCREAKQFAQAHTACSLRIQVPAPSYVPTLPCFVRDFKRSTYLLLFKRILWD